MNLINYLSCFWSRTVLVYGIYWLFNLSGISNFSSDFLAFQGFTTWMFSLLIFIDLKFIARNRNFKISGLRKYSVFDH